jgi:DNA polymerase III alpha subunit
MLDETMGVILFQEQVLGVAQAIGGFTPGEGDLLRRAMTRKRSYEEIEKMRDRFILGALEKGLSEQIADDTFDKIVAFGGYGFCKSHAAAFARTTYETAYLKLYHPAAFYAAFLNHEPLGFYSPEVILEDAKRHGVRVFSVDMNRSGAKCSVENGGIRLGFNYVKELGAASLERIEAELERGPFRSLKDFCGRVALGRDGIENLIMVGRLTVSGFPDEVCSGDIVRSAANQKMDCSSHTLRRNPNSRNLPNGIGLLKITRSWASLLAHT